MVELVLNLLLFLIALVLMIVIVATIGIVIVFVGALIEEGQGNDDGFFHRIMDAIADNI